MPSYDTFPPWKRFLSKRQFSTDNPFETQPLGPTPAFLYSQATAPLPSAATGGIWTAYPSVQNLAAHLRFGLLPHEFSIWLCRREWDPNPREPKPAEAIFEGATLAKNHYIADIPLMQGIITELDLALKATTRSMATAKVRKACSMFNKRWESTRTWDFLHRPLPTKTALLKDIRSRGYIPEGDTDALIALLKRPLNTAKEQRTLRQLLKDFLVY